MKEYTKEDMITFGKNCFYKGYNKAENDDANCYTAWREEGGKLVFDILSNEDKLLEIGCIKEGFILTPPSKLVTPVDIRRIKKWSDERLQEYIKDIENNK